MACAVALHREMGPGPLETVYEAALAGDLEAGVGAWHGKFPSQSSFAGSNSTKGFVQTSSWKIPVLVELKSVENVTKAHHRQVLTYLRLTGIRHGYVLNFGEASMRDGIPRIINGDIEQISLRRGRHFLRVRCVSV